MYHSLYRERCNVSTRERPHKKLAHTSTISHTSIDQFWLQSTVCACLGKMPLNKYTTERERAKEKKRQNGGNENHLGNMPFGGSEHRKLIDFQMRFFCVCSVHLLSLLLSPFFVCVAPSLSSRLCFRESCLIHGKRKCVVSWFIWNRRPNHYILLLLLF